MTLDEITDLRKRLGFTQTEMGVAVGLSKRAVQEIEGGSTALRLIHIAAAERVALREAAARRDPMLAPAGVRREALDIARLITG